MAKTRAQRKAEKRAREAEEQKRSGPAIGASPTRGPSTTPRFRSPATSPRSRRSRPGWRSGRRKPTSRRPDAPKPRSLRRAEAKEAKQAEKRQREEQKRREREQLAKRQKQAQAEKRQRGGVIGFLVSCWAELRKVQWPDRETLVQATAVTIIFVAVAATYLGALDSAFSFLIKQIL